MFPVLETAPIGSVTTLNPLPNAAAVNLAWCPLQGDPQSSLRSTIKLVEQRLELVETLGLSIVAVTQPLARKVDACWQQADVEREDAHLAVSVLAQLPVRIRHDREALGP